MQTLASQCALLAGLAAATAQAAPEKPISFFVLGDTRSNPRVFESNLRAAVARDPKAIAIFNTGDLTLGGTRAGWEEHHRIIQAVGGIRTDLPDWSAEAIRYVAALGNHDVESREGLANWDKFLPGQRTGGHGRYFLLKHANAAFFILDTEHPSREQTEWLGKSLAGLDKKVRWRFVFFHRPVYPCNEKVPWRPGLDWVRLLEKHKVDIAFVSDSHTYERTCPMVGGKCKEGGVVYLNSSGGGAGTRVVKPELVASVGGEGYSCNEILKFGKGLWHHHCYVEVAGDTTRVACYDADGKGKAVDSVELKK